MAWETYFPEFKVPRAIQKLVEMGMIVDSTLSHDASPNFDAVLRNGEVLTIWVENPTAGKRIGQEKRYGLSIAEPSQASRPIMETDNLGELLEAFREIMRESGGPRMGSAWRIPMYEYTGY